MTRKPGQRSLHDALAFKAYEIEELADVYFFRPLGAVIAHASRPVGISPDALTVLGGMVGVAGGTLLYWPSLGILAFTLLILHGIVDSADGQLARLTNRSSEFGRFLDGVAGYATYVAVYVAIAAGTVARGGTGLAFAWAAGAAFANILQAQMYDYHRTVYARVAVNARPPEPLFSGVHGWAAQMARVYQALQRQLIGRHAEVEQRVRDRALDGRVSEADRARYRACFYWPVRGWNLLGDNTRFYAIGILAVTRHLDWFPHFIVGPMNVALAVLWLIQERADRRFLRLMDQAVGGIGQR